MPNEAIGWTNIPADSTVIDRPELDPDRDLHVPRTILPPHGLPEIAARPILQQLPATFWRHNLELDYKIFKKVKEFWDELLPQQKEICDDYRLRSFVNVNVAGLLKAWTEEPYTYRDEKTRMQQLEDEYLVGLRKEYARLNLNEYKRMVYESIRMYVRENQLRQPPPQEAGQ
ncbi:MAG: hypothetical protein Q9209_001937 [Squamulea sp. 1 TL-2023]